MVFPVVPVAIGTGVVGVAAIGLRMRAVAKKKVTPSAPITPVAPVPPAPIPTTPAVPAAALAVEQALPPITTNPDGSAHTVGTPFVFSTDKDAQNAVAQANALGISVHELLARQSGQIGSGTVAAPTGKQAIVTTNDPAPSGDLIIRNQPNGTQIGGAEKGGTVTILSDVDATWAQVSWAGGSRWPAASGFARKAFLAVQ